MGEFIEEHIPNQILKKRNKKKSWEYGYNEEFDMVIVSKDGTISQPYMLSGLMICSPAVPKNKKDIRFHKKEWHEQVWEPLEVPKELANIANEAVDWNADKNNKDNPKTPSDIFYSKPEEFVDMYEPLIDKNWFHRKYGMWVYICGEPVWVPPSHFYQLQNIPVMGSKLPDFRFTNLDYWMFWEACKADIRSLGMIYLKNRRSGASTMAGSEMLNVGSSMSEGFLGVMSKTNRDSVSFLNRMVIRPFKKLPWYLQPETSGTGSATSGLLFRRPAKQMSSRNVVMGAEEGLDTSLKQFSCSLNSMDGELVHFMVLDECGKYPADVPFDQYYAIAEECVLEGFEVVGKIMAVSTCNSQAKGGKGYKDIYQASDITKRLDNGRTASGLYKFFIPAEWNQRGGYDKYGYSIVDDPDMTIYNREGRVVKKGNLNILIEKGDALKKQSAALYNEFLRKHPRTEQHAFRDEASDSDFNLNKIYEQMDYNELLPDVEKYERGNFINVSKEQGQYKIKWIPSPKGRFLVSWIPEPENQNNFKNVSGNLVPLNDMIMFGVDTYKVQKTVDSRGGSKGAMSGVTDTSLNVEEYPSNKFFLEYLERPATLEAYLQDMVFAMLFYGAPALIENNVDNLVKELRSRGMTHFSVRRTDKLKLSPDEKNYGGIPMQSDKVRNEHFFAIQRYIEAHVGVDDEGVEREKGEMGNMPFNRTLDSWSKFAPDNRTSEDLSISSGLALMGLRMRKKKFTATKTVKEVSSGYFGQKLDYSKSNIGKIPDRW